MDGWEDSFPQMSTVLVWQVFFMFVNVFEASKAYLAFDKTPFRRCI